MAKKIKFLTGILIFAILLASGITITVINGKSVDVVKNTAMAENTNNSLTITWKEVKGSEGYHIYSVDEQTLECEKLADVDGGDICSYKLENVESGKVYQIKVTAFKIFRHKEYESESAEPISVYTIPEIDEVKSSSPKEGQLLIDWKANKNAVGYELEYSKNEDFSQPIKETIDGGDTLQFSVDELTPKDEYYARVRAFIKVNNETVYSEWKESDKIQIKEKYVMGSDIDVKKPMIAITFDDGPGYPEGKDGNPTEIILDVLEEYNARATFFMVASRINAQNEKCLKREIDLGCELGNHTIAHSHYGKNVTASDISSCSEMIKKKCGQLPTVFRCPGGTITKTIQNECVKEGMPIAYWSIDTEDWKSKNPELIYKIATSNAYDGAIILMHDIYPTTAQAVQKIVPKLIEDGYQLVTVSELLTAKNDAKPPQAGQQYVDYKTINNNTR